MNNKTRGFFLVIMSAMLWGVGGIAGQLFYEKTDVNTPWLLAIFLLKRVTIFLIDF